MNLSIENKQINPGVINLTQFSSGTDCLVFQLENSTYENLNFKDEAYKAYAIAILPNGKLMDKIELEKNIIENILYLNWKVTNYTTKENGTLTYQIVFENQNEEVVWYSNNALMFVNSSIDVDNFLTAHYPSLLQQWLLKMEQLKVLLQECTGVPVSGDKGQILSKRTEEDFDCEWIDLSSILSDLESIEVKNLYPTMDQISNCGRPGGLWAHVYSNEYNLPKGRIFNKDNAIIIGVFDYLTVRDSNDDEVFRPISASSFDKMSSRRYKKNIRDMTEEEANKLDKIEPVIFDYINEKNGVNIVGVLAENAYEVLPNVVTLTEVDGKIVPDSIDYSNFVTYLIKRDQMKSQKLEKQDEKIDKLENEILNLKNMINR